MKLGTVVVLLSLASCGYSFRRSEVRLGEEPREEQRVFVPVVDNFTNRTGIEGLLTNAIRETLSAVRGVKIVSDVDDADFKLLVAITNYSSTHGADPRRGNPGSAREGGIGDRQSLAASIQVNLQINAKMFERLPVNPQLYRMLWSKSFERTESYETSARLTDQSGASSGPHINASRELIQIKLMSYALSRDILDQISQKF